MDDKMSKQFSKSHFVGKMTQNDKIIEFLCYFLLFLGKRRFSKTSKLPLKLFSYQFQDILPVKAF